MSFEFDTSSLGLFIYNLTLQTPQTKYNAVKIKVL